MATKDSEIGRGTGTRWRPAVQRLVQRLYQIPGLRRTARVVVITAGRLYQDDGWAMASHLTLSALMALFPFLIFVGAVAGFLGADELADQATHYLFDTVPEEIAGPIADEVEKILSRPNPGVLTISLLVTFYLASNGVDAVRAALTRAYGASSSRGFWMTRLQTAGFVVIGSLALLALALLGALGPLIWTIVERLAPEFASRIGNVQFVAYVVVGSLLTAALTASHLWLPGRGDWRELRVWPGILATLALWWAATAIFAAYLKGFANYASTYQGLAGIVTSLFYLYIMSLILIFGAEFNAAIARTSPKAQRRQKEKKEKREKKKEMREQKKKGLAPMEPVQPPPEDD